ncbi:Leucine-rich repeat protein kinase family protein [Rhynchospora pubera]|uniref:Leucine-rich repeat protein kinase family protein n=1 Tax=Rhynchospora pubera TaxID=906938 RepID=A0AAV8HXD8_9POAL|nr:Leucine-rich repeat protein kinase family protein [Rhynchospora pubera]
MEKSRPPVSFATSISLETLYRASFKNENYIDNSTNLTYYSDYESISTGKSYIIATNVISPSVPRQYETVRSFPTGSRNCYTLEQAVQGERYLLRAGFMYGNYDGSNSNAILFDLHVGVNFWKTIEITNSSYTYEAEIITVAVADFVSVCLINTGRGIPFISLLEMRPLKDSIYTLANASQSLDLYERVYMGPYAVRYPSDPYDRVWQPWGPAPGWITISTKKSIVNYKDDEFEAPSEALQFAAMPANKSRELNFDFGDGHTTTEYFFIFYFSELVDLSGSNQSRILSIYLSTDTDPWAEPFSPPYLRGFYLHANGFFTGRTSYNFSLQATENSTLPPIINAIEVFTRLVSTEATTNLSDVRAITAIKNQYGVKKNWMGDPCSPVKYAWDGLTCSSRGTDPENIIRVDLSNSGLSGTISDSFALLNNLTYLDLSYNNLTGAVLYSLTTLPFLTVLNLSENQLSGRLPDPLVKRAKAGYLVLQIDGNDDLCGYKNSCKGDKEMTTANIIILVMVAVPIVLISVVFIIYFFCIKLSGFSSDISMQPLRSETMSPKEEFSPAHLMGPMQYMAHEAPDMRIEGRQFTYRQLEIITNNFDRVVGKGGYGIVYHGCLEDSTEVAIKVSSKSSTQGRKEFFAEVQSLTKVHHKNLVALIGYCMEGEHLALVFEYMALGCLKDHLTGRTSTAIVLSWKQRLQIVYEAAKGLDYLHTGCDIIHRDVKSSNILLGQNLEAKISDFGFSKVSGSSNRMDRGSYVGLVGTPGYIDPELSMTLRHTYKSDVYSFGVVILEMLTGEPPNRNIDGDSHIAKRVSSKVAKGNINAIMDPKLRGEFCQNSVWKVVDLAMRCVALSSSQRPTMVEVVLQLKECLDLETAGQPNGSIEDDVRLSSALAVKTIKFAPEAR